MYWEQAKILCQLSINSDITYKKNVNFPFTVLLLRRCQLDSQSREAELFSQRLLSSNRGPPSVSYRYPSTGSLLQKLEIPAMNDISHDDSLLQMTVEKDQQQDTL